MVFLVIKADPGAIYSCTIQNALLTTVTLKFSQRSTSATVQDLGVVRFDGKCFQTILAFVYRMSIVYRMSSFLPLVNIPISKV